MSITIGTIVRDNAIWGNNGTDASLNTTNITGNVGIGTSTPAHKLDVTGDARIRGVLRVNSIPELTVLDTLDWSANGGVRFTTKNVGIGMTNPTFALDVSAGVTGMASAGLISRTGNATVATANDVELIDHYGTMTHSNLSVQNTLVASCANIGFTNTVLDHTDVMISGDIYTNDLIMDYDDMYDFSVRSLQTTDTINMMYKTELFYYINKHGQFIVNSSSASTPINAGGAVTRQIYNLPVGYENEEVEKVYSNSVRLMLITKTGKVFSMGNNDNGCCGIDSNLTANLNTLTRSFTRVLINTSTTQDLSAANIPFRKVILPNNDPGSSYALTVSGDLFACGRNGSGQLADGGTTPTNTKSPVVPNLVDFSGIGFVRNFVADVVVVGSQSGADFPTTLCVLDMSGGIWTAGYGGHHQTAQGSTADMRRLVRVRTSPSNFVSSGIRAIYGYGYDFWTGFMALSTTGRLYAWGDQNGNGSTSTISLAGGTSDLSYATIINNTGVLGNKDVSGVWLTNDEDGPFFVQTTDGLVYGTGQYYGLGTGLTTGSGWRQITHFNTTTKLLVNMYKVIASDNGADQSNFAVTRNTATDVYTLWATGKNSNGVLGIGNTTDQNVWVNTGLHSDIVKQIRDIVGFSTSYCCILLNNGRILQSGLRLPMYNNTTAGDAYTRFTYLS